jgi:hypothetical protein
MHAVRGVSRGAGRVGRFITTEAQSHREKTERRSWAGRGRIARVFYPAFLSSSLCVSVPLW